MHGVDVCGCNLTAFLLIRRDQQPLVDDDQLGVGVLLQYLAVGILLTGQGNNERAELFLQTLHLLYFANYTVDNRKPWRLVLVGPGYPCYNEREYL